MAFLDDDSSYSHSVTMTGSVTSNISSQKVGTSSAIFNNPTSTENNYLQVPRDSSLFLSYTWTIYGWIKTTATSRFIFQHGGDYKLYMGGTGKLTIWQDNTDAGGGEDLQMSSVISINDGNWHHFAAVRDGNNGKFFIDGVEKDTDTTIGMPNYTELPTGKLTIGSKMNDASTAPAGEQWNGDMDSIGFSNLALWWSNFTPPTSPVAVDGNTLLALELDIDISSSSSSSSSSVSSSSSSESSSSESSSSSSSSSSLSSSSSSVSISTSFSLSVVQDDVRIHGSSGSVNAAALVQLVTESPDHPSLLEYEELFRKPVFKYDDMIYEDDIIEKEEPEEEHSVSSSSTSQAVVKEKIIKSTGDVLLEIVRKDMSGGKKIIKERKKIVKKKKEVIKKEGTILVVNILKEIMEKKY